MNDEQQAPALVETVPGTIGPADDQARSSTPPEAVASAPEMPTASESSMPAEVLRTETPKSAFCVVCGAAMNQGDLFCHACGWDGRVSPPPLAPRLIDPNPSDLNRLALLLLCLILGFLGVHRFYVGKIGTGLLWLFTLGFLGMGQIVDLILIATGEFRDSEGRRVLRWSEAKPG